MSKLNLQITITYKGQIYVITLKKKKKEKKRPGFIDLGPNFEWSGMQRMTFVLYLVLC